MNRLMILALLLAAAIHGCAGKRTEKKVTENQENMLTSAVEITVSESADSTNIECAKETLNFEMQYKFEDFPVEIYRGKLLTPDFSNHPYALYWGVKDVTERCENEDINFAGHFTILTHSCGVNCSKVILVDRKSGQIVTVRHPNGLYLEEDDGAYGYEYRKDSRLLIANSTLFYDEKDEVYFIFVNSGMKPVYYVWENNKFVLLK